LLAKHDIGSWLERVVRAEIERRKAYDAMTLPGQMTVRVTTHLKRIERFDRERAQKRVDVPVHNDAAPVRELAGRGGE
jgi:hypothetical protein